MLAGAAGLLTGQPGTPGRFAEAAKVPASTGNVCSLHRFNGRLDSLQPLPASLVVVEIQPLHVLIDPPPLRASLCRPTRVVPDDDERHVVTRDLALAGHQLAQQHREGSRIGSR